MQAIMTIFETAAFMNESLRTIVNLEALNGMWFDFVSSALIHSFRASKLLLISAPSRRLYLLLLWQSAARSDPAKSTSSILPSYLPLYFT